MVRAHLSSLVLALLVACSGGIEDTDAGRDAGRVEMDAGRDAGELTDAGRDAGADAGEPADAGRDAGADAGRDAGGQPDAAGVPPGECDTTSPLCDAPCFRPISCVRACGGPVTECGCCPCATGSIDTIACPPSS